MTPEAVEALLADQDGVAWPIFVDGSRRSFQQARSRKAPTCIAVAMYIHRKQFVFEVNRWKWFPKQRRWMNLPSEAGDMVKESNVAPFFFASWNV